MPYAQKRLRFSFPGSAWENRLQNQTPRAKIEPEKLLADLLKRQARRVMSDLTECPPDTLPAHLARLDDLNEVILHSLHHWLKCTAENRLSGTALHHPYTLADYLAAMQITRAQHRAPCFLNCRDESLARIERKLDVLAGLFASSPALAAVLEEEESEVV